MDYRYFLYSLFYLIGALFFYKLNKSRLNEPKEKKANKDFRFMVFFKNWTIILMLLLASLISIFKSLK